MSGHILLVQHDAARARRIREALDEGHGGPFRVERLSTGNEAVDRLLGRGSDVFRVILVDPFGPDAGELEIVDRLCRAAPRIPVIVLVEETDEALAKRAVERGAADYLFTERLDSYWLPKVIDGIVERAENANMLFLETERARATLDSIGDGVIHTDGAGLVTGLNPIAELMTGWSSREAAGREFTEVFRLLDAETREPIADPLAQALRENKRVELTEDCLLVRRDGEEITIHDAISPVYDRSGHANGAVVVFHDASDARAMSLRMSHLAQHDHLTGLPNRMLLNDRLSHGIELARRHNHQLAVLFVDVDRFKHINDSLGHTVGDALLKSVAQRLQGCVRKSDTVSRLGGDEFIVLLGEIHQADDAALIADKILIALNAPHVIDTHELHVTASMGIGLFPNDGSDAETLMQHADVAMFHAKETGRNSHRFFQPDMNVRAVERRSIETQLRRALDNDELELHYQPQIDLETDTIAAVEALVRWRHPSRGLIGPAHFIAVAEESGLIVPLGRWVLREACRQAREWRDMGLPPVPVALNISALELRSTGLVTELQAALDAARLKAGDLELELTETALMQSLKCADSVLAAVKEVGARIALDDFGTGYSSLSYLKRFPIDALKIDKSFVGDVTTDPDDAAIVSAVVAMAQSLGQRVVAEGVETPEQLAFLRARGCRQAQGYYFMRPAPGAELAGPLRARRTAGGR